MRILDLHLSIRKINFVYAAIFVSISCSVKAQNSAAPNFGFLSVQKAMDRHLNVPAEMARLNKWNDQLNDSVASRKIDGETARELYKDEKLKMRARLFTDVMKSADLVTGSANIDLLINTSFSHKSKSCVMVFRTNPHDVTPNVVGNLTNLANRLDPRAVMRLKKVGVIDIEKVLNSDDRRRVESVRINQEAETKRKLLNEKKARLANIRKTTAIYREFVRDIKTEEREIEEDLDKAREAMDATLLVKIKSILNGLASSERFDLVLNHSFSINGNRAVIYTSPKVNDLTSSVIEVLYNRETKTDFRTESPIVALVDIQKVAGETGRGRAQIQEMVNQYGDSQNIDLIFDKSLHGADNKYIDVQNKLVLHHSSKIADITSEIVKAN